MKVRSFAAAAAMAANFLAPQAASAQSGNASISTGNDLYAACTSTDLLPLGVCLGYLQGVSDGVQTDHMLAGVPTPFCPRAQVTLQQIKDVVVTFMQNDPAIRDKYAAGIVEIALIKSFPCAAKK